MRWGIVGFGWVARDYMAPGIAAAGGSVVAVHDVYPAARDAAAAIGARGHGNLRGLLGETLDAVYVSTPNHSHRVIVEACLAAHVPVLCEKPIAATIADARAMATASRISGTFLGIAFDQRHHPAHVAIRGAIDAGAIGVVTSIRIVYACWLDRGWRAGLRPHDNWRVDLGRAGGGAVIDLALHGLDLAAMLVGEPVVELFGLLQTRVQDYEVDDGGMLVGRTAGGVLVSLHNAYNMPETLPRRRLEICGTHGQIIAHDTMGQEAGGMVEIVDAASGGREALSFDAVTSPFEAQARAFADAVRGEVHNFDVMRDVDTMALLLSACADSRVGSPGRQERRAS